MEKTKQSEVDAVLSQKVVAVVGLSRDRNKFGSMVYKSLKDQGYTVHGVNPAMQELDGEKVYASVDELPAGVGALVTVIPPASTMQVVQAAHGRGIKAVWMQQGSESPEAIAWCRANGMAVVSGQCIMMFGDNVGGIHKFHRGIKRIFGGMPVKD